MTLHHVASGIWYVDITEADVRILCGAPADAVKALIAGGHISSYREDGWTIERGPTAILLADSAVQNGDFCNLSEFPLLHMMYKQGMAIPGHPNYGRYEPTLVGLPDQLEAQLRYVEVGTWGITDRQEMLDLDIEPELADEILRFKRVFAGGSFGSLSDKVCTVSLESAPAIITGPTGETVSIRRTEFNRFAIAHGDTEVEVDLNLASGESYGAVYKLPSRKPKRDYFSVIHFGDGDGWNPDEPCMSSIVVFQERLYLIDTGPNVLQSLRHLGVSVNEIAGVFHTHAHDDHFAGLPTIFRSDRPLRHFAVPSVRRTIARKLAALMAFSDEQVEDYLEAFDLREGEWNDVDGMEVKPVYTLHPVDTTVMHFRAMDFDGYRTYAHLADICSDATYRKMRGGAPDTPTVQALYDRIAASWHDPVDLKKADTGGGLIHGEAADFVDDRSTKLVFSHMSGPPSVFQKQHATVPSFGSRDVIIPSTLTLLAFNVYRHLRPYFPGVPDTELTILANSPFESIDPGTVLIRRGNVPDAVSLILNGLVEVIGPGVDTEHNLSQGTMVAARNALLGEPVDLTYRALSAVRLMRIPIAAMRHVLQRHRLLEILTAEAELRSFLEFTPLFGDRIPGYRIVALGRHATEIELEDGEELPSPKEPSIYLVRSGTVELRTDDTLVDRVVPPHPVAEETVLLGNRKHYFQATAVGKTHVVRVPSTVIRDMPIVRWKLREVFKRRAQSAHLLQHSRAASGTEQER